MKLNNRWLKKSVNVKIPLFVFVLMMLTPFIAYADAFLFYNQTYFWKYFILSFVEICMFSVGVILGMKIK